MKTLQEVKGIKKDFWKVKSKVFDLVQKGWLSASKGAEDFNVPLADFLKLMEAAGFKFPEIID